jgi:RNA polymerase sigma-70 factor (ECF subfamily)
MESPGEHSLSFVANIADERLLVEAAQNDPSRFAELYENNFARVYAFVIRRVRDSAEAEDVTAEVFQQALANLSRFQWRGVPFAAWLLRIAANALADRWQRSAKFTALAPDELDQAQAAAQEKRKDNGAMAAGGAADVERRAMLFQLVDRLPEDQRLVVVRRFVDQKSLREIAHELGRTEGAIKQLQFRALQTLRGTVRTEKI